jgi:hypothetical protein
MARTAKRQEGTQPVKGPRVNVMLPEALHRKLKSKLALTGETLQEFFQRAASAFVGKDRV